MTDPYGELQAENEELKKLVAEQRAQIAALQAELFRCQKQVVREWETLHDHLEYEEDRDR